MSRKSIGCAIVFVFLAAAAWTAFCYSPFYQFFQHSFVTERTTFAIADTNYEIEHSRIGTHPMMAEYDRWLTVIDNGTRFSTREMAIDTCGGYPVNCYLIKLENSLHLRLDDTVSEHLVNLTDGSIIKSHFSDTPVNADGRMDGEYIGCLDGKVGKLRFIPNSELPEQEIEHLWER